MTSRPLRTSDIAQRLGVHVNTIRLYETREFLSPVPRGQNGYRQYSALHLEQARLVDLTLRWPYLGERALLVELVKSAARNNLGAALELAYHYLARVRTARVQAEVAVAYLEQWAARPVADALPHKLSISQAAEHLNVTVDMLRNWERNGLIQVPRDPTNHYRRYGAVELERLRVIRMLVQAGYSLMAILRMLRQFDAGQRDHLGAALELPREDSANEAIDIIADHWLSSLQDLEQRAQAIIHQIGQLSQQISPG